MKRHIPLLMLFIAMCCTSCGELTINKEKHSVYLDNSEITTNICEAKVSSANALNLGSNYMFSLSISIKNITNKTQEIKFSNPILVKESNEASYTVSPTSKSLSLDSGIQGSVSFSSTIPTSLDENYYFSVDFSNIFYKVFLYRTPDSLRENLTVTYSVNGEIVNTVTVKKGNPLGVDYAYDMADHQSYAAKWNDSKGNQHNSKTIIEQNVKLIGTLESNLKVSTTGSDVLSFISAINHVHKDGKVVILGKYLNKEIAISNFAIKDNPDIKEIYFPLTLHRIFSGNFEKCPNLKTIYFAGSQAEWESIEKSSTIPTGVRMVYNTSFSY